MRTDAEIFEGAFVESGPCHDALPIGPVVSADFARKIEGELNEARFELLNRPAFDYEAVGWALKKVKAFGCHNTEEGAMMTDRLEAILR